MSLALERRLLQLVVALACLVPLTTGLQGVLGGPGWLRGVDAVPPDLDSHFRYMSGIFLGVGIGFATCVPAIERQSGRFGLLAGLVVLGGLARLGGALGHAWPSTGHLFGLAMELGVVPLLVAWQHGLARRWPGEA